jgi:nicotine blue oxidoreductase
MRIAGLVLAAGAGRRFGRPKAAVRYDGVPLVERAVATLRAGGCDDVVVVLGASADDVRAVVSLDGVRVVVNDRWETGMASSLRAGLSACAGSDAALVVLVDQPDVTADVVARLIQAWATGDRPAAVAAYRGVARNPAVFGKSVWDDVCAGVAGDAGAREWLRANTSLVTAVEVGDIGSFADIDTPDDLAGH